jgi:hypothetical protein
MEQPQFVVDDPVKAINILISAVERAQQRGAYTLQESKMVYDAVTFFDKTKTIESMSSNQEKQQNAKQ